MGQDGDVRWAGGGKGGEESFALVQEDYCWQGATLLVLVLVLLLLLLPLQLPMLPLPLPLPMLLPLVVYESLDGATTVCLRILVHIAEVHNAQVPRVRGGGELRAERRDGEVY